ncbi:MAG: GNAT family N-acetyltransferase [Microthrixaceae bacterium]
MTDAQDLEPRLATPEDAPQIARLLRDFNTEYGWPSPDVDVLASRLTRNLDAAETFAVLAGTPAIALALVTLRPSVWYEGPVAMLDELYVQPQLRSRGIGAAIIGRLLEVSRERGVQLVQINVDEPDIDAQRFYRRHGFSDTDGPDDDRAFYFHMELDTSDTA